MPLPTAAELTDPNATNADMKQMLGQLAENVESKQDAEDKLTAAKDYTDSEVQALAEAADLDSTEKANTAKSEAIDTASINTANQISVFMESISSRSGWSLPFLDSLKQILGGFDSQGVFWAQNVPVVENLIDALQRIKSAEDITFLTPDPARTGIVFAIQDSAKQLLMHLDTDLKLYVAGIEIGVSQDMLNQILNLSNLINVINTSLFPLSSIVVPADSMGEGAGSTGGPNTFPARLGSILDRSVSNQGIGGQDAIRISARMNGIATLVTLANNEIPASGSVAITAIDPPLLTTPATTAARTRKCWVSGIYGTLSKDTSNAYSFARDEPGDAVKLFGNTVVTIDNSDLQKRTQVIWSGTNSSFDTVEARQSIIDCYDAQIAAIKTVEKRFLVLSPIKPVTFVAGSDTYNNMILMHTALKKKYKDRYVDVWSMLVTSYDPSNAQDVIDFNNGVIPSSKRSDSTHLNDAGYLLVAQSVAAKLNQFGW